MEKEDKILPNNAFVLGSNGQFEVSGSDCFSFIRPVTDDGLIKLQKIEPGVHVVTKIAWNDFWLGPAWLRKQWDLHCAGGTSSSKEFIILLFFNPTSKTYFWHPPKQKGSSASLNYNTSDDEEIQKLVGAGNMLVGTMHNHFGKGTAFQSGTDKHDEVKHGLPMIHFTMAWMDAPYLYCSEFHIRFVAGEYEKIIDLRDVVDTAGMLSPIAGETPEAWDKKLTIEYTQETTTSSSMSDAKKWNDNSFHQWNRGSLRGRRIMSIPTSEDETFEQFYGGWSHIKEKEDKGSYDKIYQTPLEGPQGYKEDEDPLELTKLMLSEDWDKTASGKDALNKFKNVAELLNGESVINAMLALSKMEVDIYSMCNGDNNSDDISPVEMMNAEEVLDMFADLVEYVGSVRALIVEFVSSQQEAMSGKDKPREELIVSD